MFKIACIDFSILYLLSNKNIKHLDTQDGDLIYGHSATSTNEKMK